MSEISPQMSPAAQNLRDQQRQLDIDGVEVGVSRQAIEEVLEELASMRQDVRKLRALEAGGVDNWEWYEDSLAALEDGTIP